MKSGGLRGPIIYSNPTEVEADLLRTAAGSDHEPAIGRGLGVFGSLSSSLVAKKKGDLLEQDYDKIHHGVLPVSFWSSLSPSLGIRVRVESKPDNATVLVDNAQTSFQTTAEFYAPSTVLKNVRVERRGFTTMSLTDAMYVHSVTEGESEVIDFVCVLTPVSRVGRTHAPRLDSK